MNQVYKLCAESKWSETEVDKTVNDRIHTLNNKIDTLHNNGGLMNILTEYFQPNNQS